MAVCVNGVNGMASVNLQNGSPNKRARMSAKVTVVLGAQWGDEGKGKVVDMLATDVDVVCRCQVSFLTFKKIAFGIANNCQSRGSFLLFISN